MAQRRQDELTVDNRGAQVGLSLAMEWSATGAQKKSLRRIALGLSTSLLSVKPSRNLEDTL